jgi:hypothetical protein
LIATIIQDNKTLSGSTVEIHTQYVDENIKTVVNSTKDVVIYKSVYSGQVLSQNQIELISL